MMDKGKVNGISAKENGGQRTTHSYSVETPYGFHLDLDFLKYVDDIEKGNTIKRVPVQRRQRGRNNSLSRNFSLPGHGRSHSQWNSISTLWPKPRLKDSQLYEFQPCDGGAPGYLRRSEHANKPLTTAEMEANIRAFDEQPLGLHVRPNLLRASSLPLTVLLRKGSESTEDPTSPQMSRDYLVQYSGSSEDVFHTPDRKTHGMNGTLQRLSAALERVGELEEEIRIIPELKAQICILQEERERLLLRLNFPTVVGWSLDCPPTDPSGGLQNSETNDLRGLGSKPVEKGNDDWMDREYDQLERKVKASSVEIEAVEITSTMETDPSRKKGVSLQEVDKAIQKKDSSNHGDSTKSLTVALQRKIVILEQKLHDMELELDRTRTLLRNQVEESRLKDEKLQEMSQQPAIGVKAEGVTSGTEPSSEKSSAGAQKLEQSDKGKTTEAPSQEARSTGQDILAEHGAKLGKNTETEANIEMAHHVARVQELLQEQWECLCKGESSGGVLSTEHLPQRVCSIQEQLVSLVNTLSHYVDTAHGGKHTQQPGNEPIVQKSEDEEESCPTDTASNVGVSDRGPHVHGNEKDEDTPPEQHEGEEAGPENTQSQAVPQKDTEIQADPKEDTMGGRDPEDSAHGGASAQPLQSPHVEEETMDGSDLQVQTDESEALENQTGEGDDPEKQPQKGSDKQEKTVEEKDSTEQLQHEESRATVDSSFTEACCFLKDHMDMVSSPNNEMTQALTVVFQKWFHITAEEDACADTVTSYLKEVTTNTPTVLKFLVNMVDDNGNTALHYSVSNSNFRIVRILLDTGVCDADLRNKAGYTAIMLAALTPADSPEDIKVVQQLMQLGDVNARVGQVGQTALHLAVRHGRLPIVRLLLEQGANPNVQDRAGTTPLIIACDRGHTEIVKVLLQNADCDVNLTDKGGRSALSLATQASRTDIVDLLKGRTETRTSDKCKMS
ncbi:KN motif and ankyrin repeat domain-containing protein 2 [Chanos chanos]|uniref:KN motif and ankyrin repeat domain-containing protein 2 n=1 Tax=Chanos chanos TaxID=29144 RepID=A0A6J2VDE2_CHACN|nr:KN motif and ankyrin repeat domain-containing protein 2-like [Chanos chanos]